MATQAASRPVARSIIAIDFPTSSIAFDWTMGVLSALLVCGVLQDGWAHAHGKVDQSFLTPWHAILYSSMALNGIVLGVVAVRNRMRGFSVRMALPYGYWVALIGVVLFALGGLFDLAWHSLFGIETDINALLSPSHLVLAFSATLVFTGPLRSVAFRYDRNTGGWARVGPAVLALGSTLILLAFFMGYAQPIEDGFTTATIQPDTSGAIVASAYASDASGATQTRLQVPANLDAWGIAVSPDGKHISYRAEVPQPGTSQSQPASDIYVANADGSATVRITHSGRHDTQPAWSPDGKQIAYISSPAGTSGDFSLDVVRADGSSHRTLVSGTTTLAAPAWSPDGTHIAYASRNGITDMIAMVPAGGGKSEWLTFTKDGSWPSWGSTGLAYLTGDGSVVVVAADGTHPRTVVSSGADQPSISADGSRIAYLSKGGGGSQVFVASVDGSHKTDISKLSGMDAARPAWAPNGRVFFTAEGRPSPVHTSEGFSLAEAANLLQAVTLAGVLLLIVRRWRTPPGTFTILLPLFALAMATQTDTYYDAIPALVTGLVIDGLLLALKDRARSGVAFYSLAFLLPAVFFALYLVVTIVVGQGTAWTPDMLLGSPLLAGLAGLLVAFCYQPPLPEPRTAP